MPETAHHIDGYQFSAADRLLFDANVWLFLYGPGYRPSDRRAGLYSAAYKRILEVQCRIFIDALVLSEFVNVLARLAFHSLPPGKKPENYKTFRRSPAFKPVAKSIADACRRILAACLRIESGFSLIDVDALLGRYEVGKADFNDQILAQLCQRQGLTLVTDDGDFRESALKIVTANRRLLA
jgi:predicted nucleic acid-binding protein